MQMKTFPEMKLFNTRIHKVKVQELIDYLVESVKTPKKTIVEYTNIRSMNLGMRIKLDP